MGIRGLHTYLVTNKRSGNKGTTSSLAVTEVDLKSESEKISANSGLKPILLCDCLGVVKALEIRVLVGSINNGTQSKYCKFYGSHLGTLANEMIKFVQSLRHLGIEPIFVSDGTRVHSKENQPQAGTRDLKKSTDCERQRQKLASNGTWQKVCEGYISIDVAETMFHPLCPDVCMNALIRTDVKVILCGGEADDTLISLCQENPAILGILSADTDFAAARGCKFFPIAREFFDVSQDMGFQAGKINTEPKCLKCCYTSPELLAKCLEIRVEQVADLAVLCGNDYTGQLNSFYRIRYHLGIRQAKNEANVIAVANWLRSVDVPILEHPKVKRNLHSDYKAAIEHSLDLYSGESGELTELNSQSTMTLFHHLENIIAKIKKGHYYRQFYVEYMSVYHLPAFDFTLPLRSLLYFILGAKVVSEEGRNHKKAYGRLKVPVPNMDLSIQWLTSDSMTCLSKILAVYYLVAYPHQSHKSLPSLLSPASVSRLSQLDPLMKMSEAECLHGALALAILNFLKDHSKDIRSEMFDHVSMEELQLLLAAFILVAAHVSPISYSAKCPKMRAVTLSAVVWAATVSAYPLAYQIGLSDILPNMECFFDTSIFVPLYAANRHDKLNVDEGEQSTTVLQCISKILRQILGSPEASAISSYISSDQLHTPTDLVKAIGYFQQAVCFTKQEILPEQQKELEKLRTPVKETEKPVVFDQDESESDDERTTEEYTGIASSSSVQQPMVSSGKKRAKKKASGQLAKEDQSSDSREDQLPVMKHRERILQAVSKHRVSIIDGKTGSGKSTQIPQFLYQHEVEQGRLETCSIVITQPRRMAAKSLAARVSTEMSDRNQIVGYRIGGEHSQKHFTTKITYVTAGYLLKVRIQR